MSLSQIIFRPNEAEDIRRPKLATMLSHLMSCENATTGNEGSIRTSSPTPASGTGAFADATAVIRYLQLGKLTWVHVSVFITANGTAGTFIDVSLPIAARANGSNRRQTLAAVEHQVTGYQASAIIFDGSTTLRLRKYDDTYLGGNGYIITAEGWYETV